MPPFLEVGFEKFFDSHLQNYIGKLQMITWNWSDTDCKNEWAIFTRLISLTGPLSDHLRVIKLIKFTKAKYQQNSQT